jgi:hypothetical protein
MGSIWLSLNTNRYQGGQWRAKVAREGVPGVKEQKTSILCKRLYLLVYNRRLSRCLFGRKASHGRRGRKPHLQQALAALEPRARTRAHTDADFVRVRTV